MYECRPNNDRLPEIHRDFLIVKFCIKFLDFRTMDDAATARLKAYIVDSNEALEFKLVRNVEDLENDETTFSPEMSHQVFGDR